MANIPIPLHAVWDGLSVSPRTMADLVAKAEAAEHPAAPDEKVRARHHDVTTVAGVLAPWGPLHRLYCDDVYVARQVRQCLLRRELCVLLVLTDPSRLSAPRSI